MSGKDAKMCEHSSGWKPEDGIPDLAIMSDITDHGINLNLKTRYKRDEIYTFSGSILIAVNPYKQLDIYNSQWIARYRGKRLNRSDPHIFALTEAMYINLVMRHNFIGPQSSIEPPSPKHLSQTQQSLVTNASNSSLMTHVNQACVISGESGAGKTETTKFILSYLCSITPNKSTWMEHQILEANTILEAFGNSKTVRNDNSSRFGKFIQICFDARHQINGCIIQDYLLERSRITYQSFGERNYHVFYQLLAAGQANQELRQKFHLMPANFFNYLNQTQCFTIEGVDDCVMFDSLRTAMSVLNMDQESCDGLFSVLSAILWLGNLQFHCDDNNQNNPEQCCLTEYDSEILKIVAKLLDIKIDALESLILKRQISVRGTITEIPYKVHEARDNRNGMAKALYSRLFTWLVTFINASTNPGKDSTCFLGVLDIFGFENFDCNSFEQLCINHANEKLHKFFNHHMFAMEQELYRKEGIEFCDINYTDNTPCLELLERSPNCILRLLSEECRMPKGTDSTFIEKLHTEHSIMNPHPFYNRGNDRRNWGTEFSIRHFAGMVTYKVNGFLKKNKDTQQSQLSCIIETSSNPLIRDLIEFQSVNRSHDLSDDDNIRSQLRSSLCDEMKTCTFEVPGSRNKLTSQKSFCVSEVNDKTSNKLRRENSFASDGRSHSYTNSSGRSKPTVADAFRMQLASLVELLDSTNPWYVRCIKPNLEKSASSGYDDHQVLMQLKYLGMSDLIKIRREGYPIHLTKHQFVCRYRCLMLKHLRFNPEFSPIRLKEKNLDNYCVRMMNYFDLEPRNWKIGKTMVFLKSEVYQPMEDRRSQLLVDMAILIQSSWRRYRAQTKFLKMRSAAIKIQEKFRAFRGRLLYLRKKRAVLTIQAYVRGMFAREVANALREIKRAEGEKLKNTIRVEQDEAKSSNIEINVVIRNDDSDEKGSEGLENERERHLLDCNTETSTPVSRSNTSPGVSSSASWVGQELYSQEGNLRNIRDKKEMEELVQVLERHGISLDALEKNPEAAHADFEKLYDVLGNQLQVTYDALSISPSVNEDDRCTTETNGDGDSVSCSGHSQISSNDNSGNDERFAHSSDINSTSDKDTTDNHSEDATIQTLGDGQYVSNSVESIDSIVSTVSSNLNQQLHQTSEAQLAHVQAESVIKQLFENQSRTSTFTGNSLNVAGSKTVINGRPLTIIEEEPNSLVASPSKTPRRENVENASRPQSLFPPDEGEENKKIDQSKILSENRKRRIERTILQVQQEQSQIHQPINPTTAGLPMVSNNQIAQKNLATPICCSIPSDESIYNLEKSDIIEYAEQFFNNHPRDSSSANGVIRTLTRRRKSVDTIASDHLTKVEMLSYNQSFTIPTSHVKMHDPHNVQISCSMFKNLCKYMTGESMKFDVETRIIQSIVRHGIEKSELRDEIYVQIIRQLTKNPNHEYCLRLWILLGLASAAFSPSKAFSKHLVAYIRSKPRKDPSITCHAQFCLDNLQTPRINTRRYPPSPIEIQACSDFTNMTCEIHLLDGRCETISVHPCDTAQDTLTKLAHKIGLQSTEGWALYESYTPGSSKYPHPAFEQKGDFERSVRSHHFIADLVAIWQNGIPKKQGNANTLKIAQKRISEGNFKLTLKKRIFKGLEIRNDHVEISLLYAQAVYYVVRKDSFLVNENLAITLAGLQAQVTLGNASDLTKKDPNQKKNKSTKSNKTNRYLSQIYDVDTYICVRLRHQANKSAKEWSNMIAQSHKQFHGNNEVLCKMKYLAMVIYHCPLYGTTTFKVAYKGYQSLDQNLLLGINSEGLVLIRFSDKECVCAYRYGDINRDNGITAYLDEDMIQFNVLNKSDNSIKCLTFETSDGEEVAMLIMSYEPELNVKMRGATSTSDQTLDPDFDQNATKRRVRLKMTLEDRMRIHKDVLNARRAIIHSGKLRRPMQEEHSTGLLKHTLKRLSSRTVRPDKSSLLDNIYGVVTKTGHSKSEIQETHSDYNIYKTANQISQTLDPKDSQFDVAGATANPASDELSKIYTHRYWAYTKAPLKNSLLIIHDPDLEESAIANFNAILTYAGLQGYLSSSTGGSCVSTLDTSSIDSGIASQQSLSNLNGKISGESPSSNSSGDIYDVCPRKLDERELLKLAQSILDRCLKKDADILKNEFFLQLIKQTTDHPDANSEINKRHWQLLALACSVTYPSNSKILSYLYAHLRRCSLDQITDEGQYALFTLRSLQGTLDTKGRKYAPSEMEILSTINCRRVYSKVYFLDGQFQAVEFDPCATISEVVDQIKQKIGLKQDTVGYTLFQPLDDDCEQVLPPDEKVGDAISEWESWHRQKQTDRPQNCSQTNSNIVGNKASLASLNNSTKIRVHRFVFKRYLFLDSSIDLNNPVERELLYYQIVSNIKEDKFPLLEQEATILCALKAQIEIGDFTKLSNLPREHIRMVYKQVVMSLMPPHSFNNFPIPAIAQQHQAFRELDCTDGKKYFFNLIQSFGRANLPNNPGYILLHRSHIYDATQTFSTAWPTDVWIVVNQTGFHIAVAKSRVSSIHYIILIFAIDTRMERLTLHPIFAGNFGKLRISPDR